MKNKFGIKEYDGCFNHSDSNCIYVYEYYGEGRVIVKYRDINYTSFGIVIRKKYERE